MPVIDNRDREPVGDQRSHAENAQHHAEGGADGQPPISYSRRASFSDVFRSVASLRRPMISAHARS
jgi:hypothetical protein